MLRRVGQMLLIGPPAAAAAPPAPAGGPARAEGGGLSLVSPGDAA